MKTKFKTSSNKKLLKNNNLKNNQNYIFGQNEKRKILSKYFIEKIFKYQYFNLLSVFYNIVNYLIILIWLLFHILLILSIIYFIYIDIFDRNYKNSWLILLIPILLISLWMLFWWWKYLKLDTKRIKSFKQYFSLTKVISYNSKMYTNNFKERINIHPKWIIYLLFLIISIILLPTFFIILLINIIISLINIFLFKWIKWYFFIKFSPNSFILNKFNIITEKKAENEYYRIKVK